MNDLQSRLKVNIKGEKLVTSYECEVSFELEGEEYDATLYFDDQTGFSFDAWKDQEKLHKQLNQLNIDVWQLATDILESEAK